MEAGEEKVTREKESQPSDKQEAYFLRCRILARMRRFLRPCLRRPFPDFFVPTETPDSM
jgi:hypothetical protein